MALCSAVQALHSFSFLSKGVGGVPRVGLGVALINAAAFDESLETVFICAFVY